MRNDLHTQLVQIARATPWFMEALEAAASLNLHSWCIGAGAVRNMVWDARHGYTSPSRLSDIDFAYFDSEDLSQEAEHHVQARLASIAPHFPWEATNQAAVHLWFESYFGHAVEPLGCLRDAVATWPEFATSVALTLHGDRAIEVIAPHGLDDLFDIRVRRNPARVSLDTYETRLREKRYAERWPMVIVES